MRRFVSTIQALLASGLAVLALALTSCSVVKTATDVPIQTWRAVTPGSKDRQGTDPVVVQQTMLRFADEFLARMVTGIDRLQRDTNALDPAAVLRWKIVFGTETCSIASGPNAIANLLDMTVFVTVTRMSVEDYWEPKVFGPAAKPLLESCQSAETEIWRLAGKVLKPAQKSELRQAIESWHQQNPHPEDLLGARAVSVASQV
ncbi:MAG: hypothetical protein NT154_06685, partial [Verrucomicrobia bacterium]|nr:hypothetical protein [Verrucomicrobiota bacterium]